MRRFFIDEKQAKRAASEGIIEITGKDVRHIVSVLRMAPGDTVIFCATDGKEFTAKITSCDSSSVIAAVEKTDENTTEPRVRVTLIQGVPKGDKMELIIQKCVELGVYRIQPVMTEHTVVRLKPEEAEKKRIRWQKISEEASKQCGRGMIPKIEKIVKFDEAVTGRPEDELKLLAYENEDEITLKKVLTEAGEAFENDISVIIGPEGGISLNEAETALRCGFKAISLGKRILRTETAGIAALSGIRCFFED